MPNYYKFGLKAQGQSHGLGNVCDKSCRLLDNHIYHMMFAKRVSCAAIPQYIAYTSIFSTR